MDFRIADTFIDSLARLTEGERRAVKTVAFDLQMNPAQPGHRLHRLEAARDQNFWSVRVSRDIRIIVHRMENSFMLCYVVTTIGRTGGASGADWKPIRTPVLPNWSRCERRFGR